tara:strand:- start:71 stop:208 length:138 start_codon:yes stop_codon:yes gene_type:complete
MNYLKEMNELDTGYEVVFIDENGDENSNIYDTYDKAIEFITTLQL